MSVVIDTNTLLNVSHDIYSNAAGVILDAANPDTPVEEKARALMPMKFAHEFFTCLGRCRTEKSRIHELKLLAGICHAMAYELSLAKEVK